MLFNRKVTLDSILKWEGDDLNLSPSEPGGASKFGISVPFLTDYHKNHGLLDATVDDVAALSADNARSIYDQMLLDAIFFDQLPSGVDFRLADLTTNLGITGGTRLLQLCLGMFPPHGVMDSETIRLSQVFDAKPLIIALGAAWISVKYQSPNWFPSSVNKNSVTKTGYGKGWTNRNNAQKEAALALIT